MKILVTGGAGFIGSWLVESLLAQGHSVIVVDSLTPQIHGALPQPELKWLGNASVEFIRGDVRDRTLMDSVLGRVEAVVHLAAETGTGQSMYQIARYYDVNLQATAQMLEAIGTRHRQIQRIILASSRSIYGEGAYKLGERIVVAQPRDTARMKAGRFEPLGPGGETLECVPTPEDVTPLPASVYAATKLANETLGRIFAESYGTSVLALRFQNVYGERQSLRNPYTGILSIFSNRLRQNLPINIFEDGLESRDFVHVSDVVRAVTLALSSSLEGFHAINVGAGVPTSVMEVARILRSILGSSSALEVTGDYRAGDIRHCYADLRRARNLLGFEPRVSIEDGLKRFCRWVETQPVLADRSREAMGELARLGLGSAASGAGT
ncbi:MAG: SDR family NAD(P)-dependent oxidoreductase [Nevskiaceae bacterium]|nr:MAG: SDR family NAD(P)-dependent oxidoreductase [Nevskiaceae bacterium]TBR74865.1 MAG: SDR family NAD(P)-dependent oxidoreductase [Nevskiaceae bacterium]